MKNSGYTLEVMSMVGWVGGRTKLGSVHVTKKYRSSD